MNLATNIDITNNIVRVTKWRTLRVEIFDQESTPYAVVTVQVCGADKGGIAYSNQYGRYRLIAYDSLESVVLRRTVAPQKFCDEFEIKNQVASGAYSAVVAAYTANVSGIDRPRKQCAAVDAILVSSGMLDAVFAGT